MLDGFRGTVTATVGVAMVLVVGACGPGTQADPEVAATTEAVEFAELKQAVADAADTLLDASAVETGLVARTPDGDVETIRWSARVDEHTGKFVELRRTATITEPDDIDASVRRSADGSVTWTATWQDDDTTTTYSWTTAPAGHLAEHRREFSTSSSGPITERARFEPQQDAPTITLPTEGTQLDLDQFGVWQDLPRPAADAG